ncbi:UTRA domain-containing protein [Thermobifida alba]|nr:UTRA domain-containing protein [Thermobifida alba]
MDLSRVNDDSVDYVTPRARGMADPWSAQGGGKTSQRLAEVAEVPAPRPVAEAFALAEGSPVVLRRRTMLFDGRPVELTHSYYPVPIASGTGLAEPRKIPGGAPTLLARLGYPPHEVIEDVSVRPATAAEAAELEIAEGHPVLVLFRVTRTSDGTPFEVSVMVMRPEGRHLRYRIVVG